MTSQSNQFREDEIVIMAHWEKKEEQWVRHIYPKVGGRLRMAHEDNAEISISTEIVEYDQNLAVVRAVTNTAKGAFPGIGMASVERDAKIAPAILELAETRAIARSLRFAGYGVEYCSAEEISHLENGNGQDAPPLPKAPREERPSKGFPPKSETKSNAGGNGRSASSQANGEARVTTKQLSYIVDLGKTLRMDSKDLDEESVRVFGVKMAYLKVRDASAFIDLLKEKAAA